MALPTASTIPVPLAFRSSLKVPLPLTVFTVTSIVVPEDADTDAIVPAAVLVAVNEKSATSTFDTLSLNVTRYTTEVALVLAVEGVCRLIELTEGAVRSSVYVWPEV
jgi:hypothetical protein